MTHSFKIDFTSPRKIPSEVRLLRLKSDKNDEAYSLDDENISDSDSKDSSTAKKSEGGESDGEGKHFFKKLAASLSLSRKGKDVVSKTKLFPVCRGENHPDDPDQEHEGEVVTEEKTSVSESESLDYFPDELNLSEEETEGEGDNDIDIIISSLTNFRCYDIIQPNTKLVILDNKLTLKKALHAMMETGVRACPLWDSDKQSYVGMLTITDFIRYRQDHRKPGLVSHVILYNSSEFCSSTTRVLTSL